MGVNNSLILCKILQMDLRGKKVLIVDQHMALGEELMHGLRSTGISAERVFYDYPEDYIYNSLTDRVLNIFHRNVLGNRDYYKTLLRRHFDQYCFQELKKFSGSYFDYIIVLRPDKFSIKFLMHLKSMATKMVAYNWDKIKPEEIIQRQKYFDRIAVYDPDDLEKAPGLFLMHNYHFNDRKDLNKDPEFDVLYLGSAFRNEFREEKINRLMSTGLFQNPKIIFRADVDEKDSFITKVSADVPYREYLDLVKNSKCLIDIKPSYQNGLSFRAFEALCYGKKLITNNSYIKEFDFYNTQNIYITDFENFNGLREFLAKPYMEISDEIVAKYSVKSWLEKLVSNL